MRAPLDLDALLARSLRFERSYSPRDIILYHLSLGFGPAAQDQPFVTGNTPRVLPSFAVDLAFGQRLLGPQDDFDFGKEVHGEQRTLLHRPLAAAATITGEGRITAIVDKGADKGALVIQQVELRLGDGGEKLATVTGTAFFRGDGGRGGHGSAPAAHGIPARAPDRIVERQTQPGQALLYQLNGDSNPLHWNPEFARAAGFERPILHGLCSYGIAARAVMDCYCPGQPGRITQLDTRFSAPVYPGETIVTELWRDGESVSWRCTVKERGLVVLNNGLCQLG